MDSNLTPNSTQNTRDFAFEDPRQIAIYDYLKRLVGGGTASFYKDACRYMAMKPPFEATTHVVAHLLREIESALRDVLETIAEPVVAPPKTYEKALGALSKVLDGKIEITEEIKKDLVGEFQNIEDQSLNLLEDNKSTHVNEITVILKALNIKEEDPVSKAWLSLPGYAGLQKMTHRDNLQQARPLDENFIETWENVNLILFTILEKFESQYIKVFESLDTLSKKTLITRRDVEIIKSHIPNNRVAHERFFSTISDAAWLPLLESSGFFKLPPPPEKDTENNGTRYPTWPILIYLSKVAPTSPEIVTRILSEIPDTENANVKVGLIETAIKLPKEKRIELIPYIKRWMNSGGQFFSSTKSIELIKSLGVENETESALTLTREFLDIAPPVLVEINGNSHFRDPQPFIDSWHYRKFLSDDFPAIAQQVPMNAVVLLCELLTKYIDLDRADKEEYPLQDYSFVSRPSIEKTNHLGRDDADDSLVDTIITVSVEAIDKNPALLQEVISELKKQKWPVFNRIALYLISKYPDICPDLTIESLVDTSLIDSSDFDHEYALISNSGFNLLNHDQKKKIFDFIENAEPKKERIHELAESNKEQYERMIKMWQRDKLSIFESSLEGEMKDKYDQLIIELGDADNPRTRNRMGVWTGPVSDVSSTKIGEMPIEEIIELLKTWKPQENNFGFGSSIEGLSRELSVAVKKDVARFSTFAMSFIGLDPTYVRGYIQGFSEVVQNHIFFEWEQIINLSIWVIEQPREIEGRVEKDGWDNEDPHWGWTRRAIISLVSSGLNNNVIPFNLHEKVWRIIEVLSEDPNPTPEQELNREGTLVDDAYNLTINTVRGESIVAVVEYGLWVIRRRDEMPEEKKPPLSDFSLFPNVKYILEKHLTDPSIAVRAVYGRYFPWILLLERDWTISHLKDIFPSGEFGTPLYNAAWETYVRYVSVYDDVFEVLHDQYIEAIKNIGTQEKKDSHYERRDAKLAEHLMISFWRSKLNIVDPDGLFNIFWENADEETRSYAIDFLGRSLKSLEEPLGDKEAKLLKELWEMRMAEAEKTGDKKLFEKEMNAFGWWFASGRLNEDWSIQQFLKSLEISKKVSGDYAVIDRLNVLVDTKPVQAISVLQKLIKRDVQQWLLFGSETDLKSILSKALLSSEGSSKSDATVLINKLASLGYINYSDLLLPPSPSDLLSN